MHWAAGDTDRLRTTDEKIESLAVAERESVALYVPDDYSRYSPELQKEVNARLKKIAGR